MNVLVIGSGGREHALTWKIAQSSLVTKIFCAPGNPGMAHWAECVDLDAGDIDGLIAFAAEHAIALTVVGPEDPLAAGIVDRFTAAGLKAFGPRADAARLEASKVFAKDFMQRHGIPIAKYREFTEPDEAIAYVKEKGAPIVVKADGLAAGKGVTVAQDVDAAIRAINEMMREKIFGDAGARVVIEECLVGEEASIFALSDGETILPLVSSQDHKAAYDGDTGPNTGGMGAYSPAPVVTEAIFEQIMDTVIRPCIEGMHADGSPYTGVLYAGLMITDAGPKVIEFNCRFGDPETQVVLPRMTTDLVPLLMACCDGGLKGMEVTWGEGACVTVVMASEGYPKSYE
ncbi:MAG: phosphoribosylamine--glycine ligase, partial [Candidatus Hydrogenedentes bacterium]|nr:phosphoribosylamine--glycine ligase [Candidatus Hydrogenedentota bacterium]